MARRRGRFRKKTRRRRTRSRPAAAAAVGSDDGDGDYVAGEEDEESDSAAEEPASSSGSSDEESYEFTSSDEDEDVAAAAPKRRRRSRASGKSAPAPAGSRRRRSRVSDFVVDDDDGDDWEADEDFVPDELEIVSPVAAGGGGGGRATRKRASKPRRKPTVAKKRRRRAAAAAPPSDDDDDDFEMDTTSKKSARKKPASARRRRITKKRSAVETETEESEAELEDSEFVPSDDDFVGRNVSRPPVRNVSRPPVRNVSRPPVRKKRTAPKPRKRMIIESDSSDSANSSDSDFIVDDDDVMDLDASETHAKPKLKIVMKSKGEEEKDKGKAVVEEMEKCGICLQEELKGTIQGVLDSCRHYFCYGCILAWSKVQTTCPTCRRRFKTIKQSARSGTGFGLRKTVTIRVEKRDQVYQPSEEDITHLLDEQYENIVCLVCHEGGDDNLMLLCDICDAPAHTYCIGLGREVPEGNWYCESCRLTEDGSPNSLVQDTATNHETSSGNLCCGGMGMRDLSTTSASMNTLQLPSCSDQFSPNRIDLNVSPTHLSEDHGVASEASVSRLLTPGRLATHPSSHAHFSDNIPRQSDVFSGSSNLRVQDTSADQGTSSSNLFGVIKTEDLRTNMHARKLVSLPGQSPSQSEYVLSRSSDLQIQDSAVHQDTSTSNSSAVIKTDDSRTNMHARKVPFLHRQSSSQNGDILPRSSNLRVHNTAVDQGASTGNFSGVIESEDLRTNMLARKAPSLAGQSSSQGGDVFKRSSNLRVQDSALAQGTSTSNFSGVKRTEDLRSNMHARKVPSLPGMNSSQSGDVSSRLSDLRVQDTAVDHGASTGNVSGVIESEDLRTNMHARKATPPHVQSSLQTIDLNSSPRQTLGENHGASTHAPSAVASTISGRRERHQRIRILLSSSRPRQTNGTSEVSRRFVERDVITLEVKEGISASHIRDGPSHLNPISLTERPWQNDRPVSQSTSNFAPCILSDQSNFRPVDGAKEHVLSMVKSYLKSLQEDIGIDHETFKEIARRSTHTILASCGIEHRSRMVSAVIRPPICSHGSVNGPTNLVEGCCSSCFTSFVKDVVQKVIGSM